MRIDIKSWKSENAAMVYEVMCPWAGKYLPFGLCKMCDHHTKADDPAKGLAFLQCSFENAS